MASITGEGRSKVGGRFRFRPASHSALGLAWRANGTGHTIPWDAARGTTGLAMDLAQDCYSEPGPDVPWLDFADPRVLIFGEGEPPADGSESHDKDDTHTDGCAEQAHGRDPFVQGHVGDCARE